MAANFFSNMGSRFAGNRSNKGGAGGDGRKPNGTNVPSNQPYSPTMSGYSGSMGSNTDLVDTVNTEPTKFFFQEKYSKLGVRGNFMPLAAQPKNVDLGDWLAHQCTEQYKNVENLCACISEVDGNTGMAICNPKGCPVMSAGRSHTYTWLNANKEPIKVPANHYIMLVRRWICGKLSDPRTFPADPLTGTAATYASGGPATPGAASPPIPAGPTSLTAPLAQLAGRDWVGRATGFPENFFTDCRTIFRQIFRIYAHLYHSHWLDPFWHVHNANPPSSGWTDLNSCFVHFVTVAMLFGLLSPKDLEPMQPLIDIWVANGSIPHDAAVGACAVAPAPATPMQQAS